MRKNPIRKNVKVCVMRNFIILISILFCGFVAKSQILTYEFASLVGDEVSANSNFNDPSISVSTISRGAGLTASANGGRFNATSWALTSINNAVSGNDYMEFNIAPNSGCNYSIASVVINLQRSATGPSGIALRSSLDGFASNLDTEYAIVDVTTTQTFTFTFTQSNIATATTYRIYMWAETVTGSGGPGDFTGNDIIVNGTTACGSITTGSVTGGPFAVTCSTDSSGTIAFNANGTFNAGNTFTVQLSDASGSFASPTTIGSLTGATAEGVDPSGTINFSIPATTTSSSNYLIRIVSSDPSVTSNSSASQTINLSGGPCVPSYMTALMINSCQTAGCDEGHNELIFGNTGDYSVLANAANLDIRYATTYPASADYTSSLTTNAATTSLLNTEAGCAGLFVEGTGATMPPKSSFIVARSTLCPDALDWTALCGSGPIYIIYSTSGSWSTGGNFTNDDDNVLRYLSTTITSTDATVHSIEYSFNCINNTPPTGADGDYATWTSSGGFSSTHDNLSGCAISPVLLPTGLISFSGELSNGLSDLIWQTQSEQNNDYFTLLHSTSGYDFNVIGQVQGAGNSSSNISYNFIHNRPSKGINYYKLTSTDYDGTTYFKGIVSILVDSQGSFFDSQTVELKFNKTSDYNIYTTDGKLVGEVLNDNTLYFDHQGIIIIQDLRTGLIERLFIP